MKINWKQAIKLAEIDNKKVSPKFKKIIKNKNMSIDEIIAKLKEYHARS